MWEEAQEDSDRLLAPEWQKLLESKVAEILIACDQRIRCFAEWRSSLCARTNQLTALRPLSVSK